MERKISLSLGFLVSFFLLFIPEPSWSIIWSIPFMMDVHIFLYKQINFIAFTLCVFFGAVLIKDAIKSLK